MANTQINVTKNGTTTLATAGKYCDRNIDVNVDVPGKATQFTNLYDPTIVAIKSYKYWDSSSNSFKTESQNNVNYIEIPYDHTANTPVVLRIRGIGTVRDRFACYVLDENHEYFGHYQMSNTTYFNLSYDEHGDAVITFKGNLITREWKYFGFNFQYIGISTATTALTGPIITINEPIGNGGHV